MHYAKKAVHNYWNIASCGEMYLPEATQDGFNQQAKTRYQLEPYILDFAEFSHYKQKKVLEIGVGLGADHQQFAAAGAELTGIDLTERAIEYTQRRLQLFGLHSNLNTGDAENLSFADNSFDLVYSWGVLHHSPDTQKTFTEVFRVLKKVVPPK